MIRITIFRIVFILSKCISFQFQQERSPLQFFFFSEKKGKAHVIKFFRPRLTCETDILDCKKKKKKNRCFLYSFDNLRFLFSEKFDILLECITLHGTLKKMTYLMDEIFLNFLRNIFKIPKF